MIFLDPNLYCYTREEWAGGDALVRLDSLLDVLVNIERSERLLETVDNVSFLLPDDLLLFSYEANPNVNDPPNSHYFRLFNSRIMPMLQRRMGALNLENACDKALSEYIGVDSCVAEQALVAFLESVSCTEVEKVVYAYHPQRTSIKKGSQVFCDEVAVDRVCGSYFADYRKVYPLASKHDPIAALNEAISILNIRLAYKDPTWLNFRLSRIFLHEDFIQSVEKADFRAFTSEYEDRILYAILQVATSRNVTVQEHTMTGQKVRYSGQDHQKWNAYVFQMGPNAQDVRCSRLYFSKIKGGVLLFNYEPDAH